jgi:hypothetical protein
VVCLRHQIEKILVQTRKMMAMAVMIASSKRRSTRRPALVKVVELDFYWTLFEKAATVDSVPEREHRVEVMATGRKVPRSLSPNPTTPDLTTRMQARKTLTRRTTSLSVTKVCRGLGKAARMRKMSRHQLGTLQASPVELVKLAQPDVVQVAS